MSAADKNPPSSFEIPANHPWANLWKVFAGVAVVGVSRRSKSAPHWATTCLVSHWSDPASAAYSPAWNEAARS